MTWTTNYKPRKNNCVHTPSSRGGEIQLREKKSCSNRRKGRTFLHQSIREKGGGKRVERIKASPFGNVHFRDRKRGRAPPGSGEYAEKESGLGGEKKRLLLLGGWSVYFSLEKKGGLYNRKGKYRPGKKAFPKLFSGVQKTGGFQLSLGEREEGSAAKTIFTFFQKRKSRIQAEGVPGEKGRACLKGAFHTRFHARGEREGFSQEERRKRRSVSQPGKGATPWKEWHLRHLWEKEGSAGEMGGKSGGKGTPISFSP